MMDASKLADIRKVHFDRDVYEPAEDSFMLVDALQAEWPTVSQNAPSVCLEIGCGTGYVICTAALFLKGTGATCYAVDINPTAVEATRKTCLAHEVHAEVLEGDLAAGLEDSLAGCVDVLLFNPPYVLTPDEEVGSSGIEASWAGGYKGRMVIDRVLPLVPTLLSPKGTMLMILLHDNDPDDVSRILQSYGLTTSLIMTRAADEEKLHVMKVVWGREQRPPSELEPPIAERLEMADIRRMHFDSACVYEPAEDSFMLANALQQEWPSLSQPGAPAVVLEIGCGTGYVICTAAMYLKGRGRCYATDISLAAVQATQLTCAAHNVEVETHTGDITAGLEDELAGRVDLLLFNPPYVLTPDEEVGSSGIEASWAGGHKGRVVIDRVLPLVPTLLSPKGTMLMILLHDNDPDDVSCILQSYGLITSLIMTRAADEEKLHVMKVTWAGVVDKERADTR